MQPPSANERVSRLIGQFVVAIEEKSAQLDQASIHIEHLEAKLKKLEDELAVFKGPSKDPSDLG